VGEAPKRVGVKWQRAWKEGQLAAIP